MIQQIVSCKKCVGLLVALLLLAFCCTGVNEETTEKANIVYSERPTEEWEYIKANAFGLSTNQKLLFTESSLPYLLFSVLTDGELTIKQCPNGEEVFTGLHIFLLDDNQYLLMEPRIIEKSEPEVFVNWNLSAGRYYLYIEFENSDPFFQSVLLDFSFSGIEDKSLPKG